METDNLAMSVAFVCSIFHWQSKNANVTRRVFIYFFKSKPKPPWSILHFAWNVCFYFRVHPKAAFSARVEATSDDVISPNQEVAKNCGGGFGSRCRAKTNSRRQRWRQSSERSWTERWRFEWLVSFGRNMSNDTFITLVDSRVSAAGRRTGGLEDVF